MMGDEGDLWNAVREARRTLRAQYGVPCPVCIKKLPKACPTILLPQQVCRIHGYRDPRACTPDTEYMHKAKP